MLSRNRHSSERSLVAHLTVRTSSTRNNRLPLSSTSKGNDGTQVFLTLACGACGTHGCQVDMWERSSSCFAASLFPHSAASCLVSASALSCSSCLSPLCAGGMCTLCFRQNAESRALMSGGLSSEDTVSRGRLFKCVIASGLALHTLTGWLFIAFFYCAATLWTVRMDLLKKPMRGKNKVALAHKQRRDRNTSTGQRRTTNK